MNAVTDWKREEVDAIVADYFEMLGAELSGVPYNKTAHRRRLVDLLAGRSEASIEFKHGNISAVLIDLGFPYITGYKPRFNYQALLFDSHSFDESGKDRLIEVKTTKYGQQTPFFVSRNEVAVSEAQVDRYHLYRLYEFQVRPQLFILGGANSKSCLLTAATYMASVRSIHSS